MMDDTKKLEIKEVKLEEIQEEETDDQKMFGVPSAIRQGGHNKYLVQGFDSDGPFEDHKRFRDFEALQNAFASRWPGMYIPALPEQKVIVSII